MSTDTTTHRSTTSPTARPTATRTQRQWHLSLSSPHLPSIQPTLLSSPFLLLLLLTHSTPTHALRRTIGSPSDTDTQTLALTRCDAGNPLRFTAGQCPYLVNCVQDVLPGATSAGFGSGTNIASLVPTATALVGAPPLDIIQLALTSPHRALATCLFGVGLPSGLFRQLRAPGPSLSDANSVGTVREWRIKVPKSCVLGAKGIAWQVGADVVIGGLAGVMLWRNLVVGFETVVTWRCEYGWLLFCWPMACLIWLLTSITILWLLLARNGIEVFFARDGGSAEGVKTDKSLLSLMLLPYHIDKSFFPAPADQTPLSVQHGNTWPHSPQDSRHPAKFTNAAHPLSPTSPAAIRRQQRPHFTIKMHMPSSSGLRSWRTFEAFIETMAVGIYLFATFVLTSVLFLSGQEAIIYATVLILSQGVIRFLGLIF